MNVNISEFGNFISHFCVCEINITILGCRFMNFAPGNKLLCDCRVESEVNENSYHESSWCSWNFNFIVENQTLLGFPYFHFNLMLSTHQNFQIQTVIHEYFWNFKYAYWLHPYQISTAQTLLTFNISTITVDILLQWTLHLKKDPKFINEKRKTCAWVFIHRNWEYFFFIKIQSTMTLKRFLAYQELFQ